MPVVSVTIPVYNGAAFIETAIRSALAQTYGDLEVVVVDDGSSDASGDIVRAIADPRVRYLRQANRGLAATRNVLVEESRGEFLAFLDQDDWWEPSRLARQLPLFTDPDVALVYADSYVSDAAGQVLGRLSQRSVFRRGRVFEPLLQSNFVPLSTVTIRRRAMIEVGPFLPYKVAEEYDIFLKCAARYRFEFVDEPLATCRIHAGQFSLNYEAALSELVAIYGAWAQAPAPATPAAIDRAIGHSYYVAGKNAIYLESDVKKARRFFRESLRRGATRATLGFFALSFLGASAVKRARRGAARALGTFSLTE